MARHETNEMALGMAAQPRRCPHTSAKAKHELQPREASAASWRLTACGAGLNQVLGQFVSVQGSAEAGLCRGQGARVGQWAAEQARPPHNKQADRGRNSRHHWDTLLGGLGICCLQGPVTGP